MNIAKPIDQVSVLGPNRNGKDDLLGYAFAVSPYFAIVHANIFFDDTPWGKRVAFQGEHAIPTERQILEIGHPRGHNIRQCNPNVAVIRIERPGIESHVRDHNANNIFVSRFTEHERMWATLYLIGPKGQAPEPVIDSAMRERAPTQGGINLNFHPGWH